MALRSLIAFSLVALIFAACESKPPTVGEPKDFEMVCSKANKGKRIAVEGYLRLPETINPKVGPVLRLYRTNDFNTVPIGVSTDFGTQPNHVETVPERYSHKDLKVHLANGQVVGFGTKVKVSGEVYFPLLEQEFPCAVSNPLVEIAE